MEFMSQIFSEATIIFTEIGWTITLFSLPLRSF